MEKENSPELQKKKRQFKMPHTLVILICVILAACLLTWIIPAGSYVREKNEQGIKVLLPDSFEWTEAKPVNPLTIPKYIVEGIIDNIELLLLILFSGGAYNIIVKSGAIQSSVAKVAKRYSKKPVFFIAAMTTVFALLCTSQGVNKFISFAPILVMISYSLGLDSIVGVACLCLGGAVGFSTGTLVVSTTINAQKIAELPLYSGIEFRFVCWAVFLAVTILYIVRYANKIKAAPTQSPMYDLDRTDTLHTSADLESFGPMSARKWLVLASMVIGLGCIAVGGIKFGLDTPQYAEIFLWMALASGLCAGLSFSQVAKQFVEGASKMIGTMLIIGTARAIAAVLTDGGIVDTVVYGMANVLRGVPTVLQGPAMFLFNIIINIFITSGSGQASAVMPILTPLSDLIGMTRQTAILSFNFGDGFCNYILPTSSALMGALGMVNVPYDRWMKFMWKLFLIWFVVGSILVSVAQMIHFGPF